MIRITIHGEPLDLLPDATLTIEEESPLFNTDSIPGGYSYPFNLPTTPRNRRLLGFPDRISRQELSILRQPFVLSYNGRRLFSGTLEVSEAGEEYRANLLVQTGNLAAQLKNRNLPEVDFGGELSWQWKPEYSQPADAFALAPVFNPAFFNESYLKDMFRIHGYRINAYENGAYFHNDNDIFAVCPFLFLSVVINRVFETFGYQVVENCLDTDPDLRDLVIYSIRDISRYGIVYQSQEVSLGVDQYGQENFVNTEVGTVRRTLDKYNLAECVPDIPISEFLLSIRNFLNLSFVIDPGSDRVRILKRQELLNQPALEISNLAAGPGSTVRIPDGGFKLEWEIDKEDVQWGEDYFKRIEEFSRFLKEPLPTPEDLEGIYPTPGEIRYIESLDQYFRYDRFEYAEGLFHYRWLSWSVNFQNLISGAGSSVYSSKVAPMIMATYRRDQQSAVVRIPWAEQPGSHIEESSRPEYALRLLFYRGMIQDSLGNPYPYATIDNLDRTGNPLPGKSLSIKFQGESGIYNQLWKHYLTWWCQRIQVNFTIIDPSGLAFDQIYRIHGNNLILKKRTVTLANSGIQPGKCEFYRI